MKPNLPNKQEKEPVKVLSLQEQESLIKEEIQRFLKLAKEKGALTIEEINELLPLKLSLRQSWTCSCMALRAVV